MYRSRRVATVILARTGARRLPGKMLLPFGAGTVLASTIERLRACTLADEIVLATTACPADDELARAAAELGVHVVRGSEHDVVGRMCLALDSLDSAPDVVIRACADNPLVMPTVVDGGVRELVDHGADVVTPFEHATYPFGFGLVVLARECLERIDRDARASAYREHVENYCFEHPDEFRVRHQVAPPELELPELCLTLDYRVDYDRLRRIERRLRDVDLRDQPRAVVDHVRSVRVWVEGRNVDSPSGYDLVVASERPVGLVATRPSCGLVVVERAEIGGAERFVLRYDAACGPDFPRGSLFVDRRALRAEDTPARFLSYALPLVLPSLLAAPARPVDLREACAPLEKRVQAARRRGFTEPGDASFPPRIAIQMAETYGGTDLLERLVGELEDRARGALIVHEEEDEAFVARMLARLGGGRVRRGAAAPDAFGEVRLDASGRIRAGTAEADFEHSSIAAFWNSPALRRARATALNEGRA